MRQWRIADPEGFDNDNSLEALRPWLQHFLEDPRFERLMQRADPWNAGGNNTTSPPMPWQFPRIKPCFT